MPNTYQLLIQQDSGLLKILLCLGPLHRSHLHSRQCHPELAHHNQSQPRQCRRHQCHYRYRRLGHRHHYMKEYSAGRNDVQLQYWNYVNRLLLVFVFVRLLNRSVWSLDDLILTTNIEEHNLLIRPHSHWARQQHRKM